MLFYGAGYYYIWILIISKITILFLIWILILIIINNILFIFFSNNLNSTGNISFKGTDYPGNIKFRNGQLVTLELNADCGTLHFFVDGIQQPMFVSGINEPVKFFVWWELIIINYIY